MDFGLETKTLCRQTKIISIWRIYFYRSSFSPFLRSFYLRNISCKIFTKLNWTNKRSLLCLVFSSSSFTVQPKSSETLQSGTRQSGRSIISTWSAVDDGGGWKGEGGVDAEQEGKINSQLREVPNCGVGSIYTWTNTPGPYLEMLKAALFFFYSCRELKYCLTLTY